jgi:hypothetical protein
MSLPFQNAHDPTPKSYGNLQRNILFQMEFEAKLVDECVYLVRLCAERSELIVVDCREPKNVNFN